MLTAAEALAQLDPDEARRLLSYATARRRRQQHDRLVSALRAVAAEYFPELKPTPQADEIALAACSMRTARLDTAEARGAAARRRAVRDRLIELLGDITLVPKSRRIRQLLGSK
jgi:hypothetical protein